MAQCLWTALPTRSQSLVVPHTFASPDENLNSWVRIQQLFVVHLVGKWVAAGFVHTGYVMHLNPTLVDRFFPFRGTWSFPWIVQRYFRSSSSAFTPKKLANAALAFAEMQLARPVVRSRPAVLRLEPSNVCNLRCPNCACGTGRDARKKGLMEMADLECVLRQTSDSAIVARLDGMGEPTLHPEIFDMIRLIKSHNISVSMSTNFCLLYTSDAADE